MKSGRVRIVTTLFGAVALVATYFAAELHHQNRTSVLAQTLVTDASRSLLDGGDADAFVALLDETASVQMPDVAFLSRFGELLAMDNPSGETNVPPLFSAAPGTASFSMRAHFALGTADIQAQMEYRNGLWKLLSYELTPGPGVM